MPKIYSCDWGTMRPVDEREADLKVSFSRLRFLRFWNCFVPLTCVLLGEIITFFWWKQGVFLSKKIPREIYTHTRIHFSLKSSKFCNFVRIKSLGQWIFYLFPIFRPETVSRQSSKSSNPNCTTSPSCGISISS